MSTPDRTPFVDDRFVIHVQPNTMEISLPLTGTDAELAEVFAYLRNVFGGAQMLGRREAPRRDHENLPVAALDGARMGAGLVGCLGVWMRAGFTDREQVRELLTKAIAIIYAKVQPKGE